MKGDRKQLKYIPVTYRVTHRTQADKIIYVLIGILLLFFVLLSMLVYVNARNNQILHNSHIVPKGASAIWIDINNPNSEVVIVLDPKNPSQRNIIKEAQLYFEGRK